jgi:hypothetical protein
MLRSDRRRRHANCHLRAVRPPGSPDKNFGCPACSPSRAVRTSLLLVTALGLPSAVTSPRLIHPRPRHPVRDAMTIRRPVAFAGSGRAQESTRPILAANRSGFCSAESHALFRTVPCESKYTVFRMPEQGLILETVTAPRTRCRAPALLAHQPFGEAAGRGSTVIRRSGPIDVGSRHPPCLAWTSPVRAATKNRRFRQALGPGRPGASAPVNLLSSPCQ